jgi:hypothetical protein
VVNNSQRIRKLNDELRQNLHGGLAVMTPGVAALGQQAVERIVQTIMHCTNFENKQREMVDGANLRRRPCIQKQERTLQRD